jgi:hypothetical protein
MSNVRHKFNQIIRKLNYNQIKVLDIDSTKLEEWSYNNIPEVVKQLKPLGWDLEADSTWEETLFLNTIIKWYENKVGLYVTSSYLDYKLASSLLDTIEFSNLRKYFNLSNHSIILVDPIILIEIDDLDTLYCKLDFSKGYSSIDYSHYDNDKDVLYKEFLEEWNWLEAENQDENEMVWTAKQIHKVLNN